MNRVLFIVGIGCCVFAALTLLLGWTRPNNGWAIAIAILGIGLITASRRH